jgi:hypothetical protein
VSKHKYETCGGALRLTTLGDDHRDIGLQFNFYILDIKDKFVAYYSYVNELSATDQKDFDASLLDNEEAAKTTQRVYGRGIGKRTISRDKPIGLKAFKTGKMSGKLSIDTNKDRSNPQMTATVTLDKGHVSLSFLVAGHLLSHALENTRGWILVAKTEKLDKGRDYAKFPAWMAGDEYLTTGRSKDSTR